MSKHTSSPNVTASELLETLCGDFIHNFLRTHKAYHNGFWMHHKIHTTSDAEFGHGALDLKYSQLGHIVAVSAKVPRSTEGYDSIKADAMDSLVFDSSTRRPSRRTTMTGIAKPLLVMFITSWPLREICPWHFCF